MATKSCGCWILAEPTLAQPDGLHQLNILLISPCGRHFYFLQPSPGFTLPHWLFNIKSGCGQPQSATTQLTCDITASNTTTNIKQCDMPDLIKTRTDCRIGNKISLKLHRTGRFLSQWRRAAVGSVQCACAFMVIQNHFLRTLNSFKALL